MKERILKEKIYRMIEAAGELSPGVTHIEVKHDDGCPALKTHSLADCICEPDFKKRSDVH
jgi:hypothetical protein